jgi:hypothetical protein
MNMSTTNNVFWTLSIILFLFNTPNVSETGFCLRLQVKPAKLGPIDRANPYLWTQGVALSIGPN